MGDGLGSGGGLADDLEPLRLEEVPQAGAEEILVVDEQNAERLRRARLLPPSRSVPTQRPLSRGECAR